MAGVYRKEGIPLLMKTVRKRKAVTKPKNQQDKNEREQKRVKKFKATWNKQSEAQKKKIKIKTAKTKMAKGMRSKTSPFEACPKKWGRDDRRWKNGGKWNEEWTLYESMDDFITINFGVKTTTKRRRAMYRKISKCLSKKSNEAYKFYLREGGEQGEEDDSDDDSDDDL